MNDERSRSLVKADSASLLTPFPSEFKLLLLVGYVNAALAILEHKMNRRPVLVLIGCPPPSNNSLNFHFSRAVFTASVTWGPGVWCTFILLKRPSVPNSTATKTTPAELPGSVSSGYSGKGAFSANLRVLDSDIHCVSFRCCGAQADIITAEPTRITSTTSLTTNLLVSFVIELLT